MGFIIAFVILGGGLFVYKKDKTDKEVTKLTLPIEAESMVKQMAHSTIGVLDVPELIYASKERVILYDYWGLIVYDLKQSKIIRAVDLPSMGLNHIQGDQYTQFQVNKDGTQILMQNQPLEYANPKHTYLYDIKLDSMTETTMATFEHGEVNNLYDVSSDEVIKEFGTQSMDGFKGRTYGKVDNQWIYLRMDVLLDDDGSLSFDNMMNLTISVVDEKKNSTNIIQVFHDYIEIPGKEIDKK